MKAFIMRYDVYPLQDSITWGWRIRSQAPITWGWRACSNDSPLLKANWVPSFSHSDSCKGPTVVARNRSSVARTAERDRELPRRRRYGV